MLPDLNEKRPEKPKPETDFALTAKRATGRGLLAILERGHVVPGAHRRAQQAVAQKQSASIIKKMEAGFGHPAYNPVARMVPKS